MKILIKKSALQKKLSIERVPLKNFVYLSFIISIVGILLIFLLQSKLPPEVPLFYGLPEGEEQLTTSLGLTLPLVGSLIITILNTITVFFLQNSFLQKTLVLVSFAVSFLSFVTIVKITLLVGSF
ncbi:hypothetical protein A2715_03690 [Candidatus Woesebacteria bacterium RIFCSPHIGHO2_01_FULL_39_32]|uniref:DUF1648 domain-containing protein n=2 Tax=Candidatus Woeseibacteriota TaxID=1752722 RepID=A0A0G0S2B1_9BACT|nr:MAG: hypothetical protein UT61_C0041G0007 [Candidatus Woesebacteria bacterium GW2011_GWA1_39_8]OGM05075.1 MAG: hypothetical protein A2124_04995 [Candidatus Woesebacteria bacterium GWB1_37_5]OGM24842.1 MAG: hypothetical protein A2715_03690 [Candidatus Woesebacteria bacterium RIFCSPHIGHO2_01_FULL_39_32]OGM37163.1 MAG: hypothetical protein A3F01_05630 [Candidatus Woesebacteria bacterium RIFCSPHIGHO2_12_FULL_38_11]OGM64668.1 MAG: hypothetical protein A2893_06605 [Candidatus Woesebacteria bacteri